VGCIFDYSAKTPGKVNAPPGCQYINRSDMFAVLRYRRGWKVEVSHENRTKWRIRVTGASISEILCDLPDFVTDNHLAALTSIYARVSNGSEAAGICGHT